MDNPVVPIAVIGLFFLSLIWMYIESVKSDKRIKKAFGDLEKSLESSEEEIKQEMSQKTKQVIKYEYVLTVFTNVPGYSPGIRTTFNNPPESFHESTQICNFVKWFSEETSDTFFFYFIKDKGISMIRREAIVGYEITYGEVFTYDEED